MKLLNALFALGNIFFGAFVTFKTYGWFYTEVGFELPTLNYLQVLALSCIIFIFTAKPYETLTLVETYKEEQDYRHISAFLLWASSLLIFWLIKITLY